MGSVAPAPGPRRAGVYVVHEHSATRHHWDLRLEIDGILCSWAVPKVPSMDPDDKRLAVKVENHPLEYVDFEAVIPPGNYGAGPMIVWDRGQFLPLIDPRDGLKDGEIKFELRGYKLRGAFTLVHTGKHRRGRGGGKGTDEWLLIKKRDEHTDAFLAAGVPLPMTSILSGLTVEELRDGASRVEALRADLAALEVPAKVITPASFKPMLCQSEDAAFTDDAWLFELKYDGYRLIAFGGAGKCELRYRSGLDATARYPELVAAVRALPCADVVLDGEVVVTDGEGKPRFHLLQQRAGINRVSELQRAAGMLPATFFVFDLLGADGKDLRGLPLIVRKALAKRLLPPVGPMRWADHVDAQGEAFLDAVAAQGLEGIVAKRRDSVYRGVRSPDWRKIKIDPDWDFAICGFTPPKGSRTGLGALYLCLRDGERWVFAGKVGSGLDDAELSSLRAKLDAAPKWKPPFPLPERVAGAKWVEPTMVCTVRFREWIDGEAARVPRHPVFLGLRDDKPVDDCVVDQPDADRVDDEPRAEPALEAEPDARELRLTNLKKVFWPEHGYTKGDLIDYYRAIAPWMLPYLKDRPAVMTRFPDGIHGKSFYQKDLPGWVPPWLRTTVTFSEHSQREIHYVLIDDADGLAFVANMGSIPLHVWASRMQALDRPDWTIIDFDPKNAPREWVVPLALAVHDVLETIGLPGLVKTSGQTGLHVLVPLAGQCDYDQARTLAYLISLVVEHRHRDMATTLRNPAKRGGRVYLDWGQNAQGQLLVAPYSVRPVVGANVSMPLTWDEVVPGLDPGRFTIKTALDRVERREDPVRAVLTLKPDLVAALTRLQALAPT